MLSATIKINQANLKNEIETNYFYWLDVFHRCFAVSLVLHSNSKNPILETTLLENSHYNQLLHDIDFRYKKGYNVVEDINSKNNIAVFLDLQVYLEEFLTMKHNSTGSNIYNLTIDHEYNLVITHKQLGKRYSF